MTNDHTKLHRCGIHTNEWESILYLRSNWHRDAGNLPLFCSPPFLTLNSTPEIALLSDLFKAVGVQWRISDRGPFIFDTKIHVYLDKTHRSVCVVSWGLSSSVLALSLNSWHESGHFGSINFRFYHHNGYLDLNYKIL